MEWYGRICKKVWAHAVHGRWRRHACRRCAVRWKTPGVKFMTTNADTLFSAIRRRTSSLVMALALLAACPPSWAAESGQAGAAPGGLEIPPLVSGEEQSPPQMPPAAGQAASQASPEGQQAPASQPPRRNVPREDIVSGTGQSFGGYSGTWHDAERDETVTTIIAPRQPMVQQPPMYIAPQVYPDSNGNWSQGGGYYPPQWYPDPRPPRTPRPPYWDQRLPRPPYPSRPPSWDQRPPYPSRPPSWGQRPPYPSRPPSWNPGQRPPQGGGIPPSWWRGSGQ